MAERLDPWSSRRASGTGNGEDEITFTNVRILDGTGERPYAGEVTVAGNRIRSITRSGGGYQWNHQRRAAHRRPRRDPHAGASSTRTCT